MRTTGRTGNFVFFDLSKLDVSSIAAFLADWSRRVSAEGLSKDSRCHWIFSPVRLKEVLTQPGPGADFLRERLSSGDRLFCTNPTGVDWSHLFPLEAHRERGVLNEATTQETFLFLETTTQAPEWINQLGLVFRPSSDGLWIQDGTKSVCLPWARKDTSSKTGVWWMVPGQALLTTLPAEPWVDLPERLPQLWEKPGRANSPSAPSPLKKIPLFSLGLSRHAALPTPIQKAVLFRSNDYPGLGTKEAVDFEEALGGIRKRSLVANMQGQTELQEAGILARFQGGRLLSITDTKAGKELCGASETFLVWGGTRHPFVVNSAFSFEGDYSWGLRQSLVLADEDLAEPGRAILDFFFVEESQEFFVAASVRWPRWKSPVLVQQWAVLEMSLFGFSRSETLTSRAYWPDGEAADSIHRGKSGGVLTGTDFVFSAGSTSLVLGFPQNQISRPHFLPWSLERRWHRSCLVVNPEGGQSARSSTEFEGIEEHFSFYIGRTEGAKLPFSPTRKQAMELIPPYVIQSESAVPKRF